MILKYTLGLSQRTNACFFFTEFTSIISGTQLTASVVKTISNFPNSGEKKKQDNDIVALLHHIKQQKLPNF